MIIDPQWLVRDILLRYPAARAVLARAGVDQCCGGVHPLRMAAQAHGVNLGKLLAELERSVRGTKP
ncbi:MAG: DUF542 domain-containing protein [Elusimicrobia bacterium]|nr:DUF542 domain-containing protein [Elusimicrobiota bacterium]